LASIVNSGCDFIGFGFGIKQKKAMEFSACLAEKRGFAGDVSTYLMKKKLSVDFGCLRMVLLLPFSKEH
jgi:hypothetical protein